MMFGKSGNQGPQVPAEVMGGSTSGNGEAPRAARVAFDGPAGAAGAGLGNAVVGTPILEVQHIEKVYGGRNNATRALVDVSFAVGKGEFVGIMGASGSGKSTLLNCVSTIDTVTSGSVVINGADVTRLKNEKLTRFRREQLGFIFQDSNLLDTLTARENIALPLTIARVPAKETLARVE